MAWVGDCVAIASYGILKLTLKFWAIERGQNSGNLW